MGLWYVGLGAAGTNAAAAAGDDDDADIAACITSLQDLTKNGRAEGSKFVYIFNNLRNSVIQSKEIIFILRKWQRESLSEGTDFS